MPAFLSRRSRALVSGSVLALILAGGTGCGTVQVPPGPQASDPACAAVIQGAPDELLGQARHETSSQATVAWGEGDDAVVLRCGVQPPGPTTDPCSQIEATNGVSIDWLVRERDGIVTFTTFGRTPAIDVSVPRSVAPDQPSAAVLDLAGLIAPIRATDHCVGAEDVR